MGTQEDTHCFKHIKRSYTDGHPYCPICYDWLSVPNDCDCIICQERPKNARIFLVINKLKGLNVEQ